MVQQAPKLKSLRRVSKTNELEVKPPEEQKPPLVLVITLGWEVKNAVSCKY